MSRYDWERGTIVIPTAQWAGFKKTIRDAWNAAVEADLKTLDAIRVKVLEANKGKRGVRWSDAVREEAARSEIRCSYSWGGSYANPAHTLLTCDPYSVAKALGCDGAGSRPKKPKKSEAKFWPKTVKCMSFDEASVSFNDESHSVTWSVRENNHACDDAHRSFLGRTLFSALKKVQFTRNSGGVIVGNDENNCDDRSEGGGANYVTARFGPLGESSRA